MKLMKSEDIVAEPKIVTFGCRLNSYESDIMRQHLQQLPADDVIVVNSCAVTGEAERQVKQSIRKLRRDHPSAKILVTGCAAQLHPADFAAMPEVNGVLGNLEKLDSDRLAEFVGVKLQESHAASPPVAVQNIMEVRETAHHLLSGVDHRTRAFLQIQQGCDHRCTFCIIPYARGNSRSTPADQIIHQIQHLLEAGVGEVVLTGVDITSYGHDLSTPITLGQLTQQILRQVPELKRLRLSSIDPIEIDPALWEVVGSEPRLMPHLHLSLQAGDTMILKRMKRRHSAEQAVKLCDNLRTLRPDIALGADIIAGFPTETEDMFQNSLRHVQECGISFLHVFPYSSRTGTPAAKMPQLPMEVRRERASLLRQMGDRQRHLFFKEQQGKTQRVLVEKREEGYALGHSQHFAPVRLSGEAKIGQIVQAIATAWQPTFLLADMQAGAA